MKTQPLPDAGDRPLVPTGETGTESADQIVNDGEPNAQPFCAVVMVSYHTGPVLAETLRAALDQDGVAQVVLVDNGNPADVREMLDTLAQQDPRLTVVRGHGNVGFSRGCNLGVRQTTAEYVLLLNPDCMLRPGVLSRAVQAFEQTPEASMVTVRIENPDGSEQRGGRRNLLTPWTCLVEGFRLDRLMPNHPAFQRMNLNETAALQTTTPVQCISGAFMLLPHRVYDSLGGMDEDYFLHVEEMDFCMRIKKSGGVILYVPDVSVTHVKGTSSVSPLTVEWHKSVSVWKYFRKHFRPQYPNLVLFLVSMAVFARLAIRGVPTTARWLWQQWRSPTNVTNSQI